MILLIILILATSILVGYLLAYLCRDELVEGRIYFLILMIISLIAGAVTLILGYIAVFLTLMYIFIVSLISLWKSYDKKFVRKI